MNITRTDDQLANLIRRGFDRFQPSTTTLPVKASEPHTRRLAAFAIGPVGILLVAFIVVQALRPATAFASWSAVPTSADPDLETALLTGPGCRNPVTPGMTADERAYAEDMNALPMVLVDQRGTSAVALFAERRAAGIASKLCLGSRGSNGVLTPAGSGGGVGLLESPSDGPLRLFGRVQIMSRGETLTAAQGTADATVTKVVIARSSGGDVTATVKDGYWVAWWPGDSALVTATAFDAGGIEIDAISP